MIDQIGWSDLLTSRGFLSLGKLVCCCCGFLPFFLNFMSFLVHYLTLQTGTTTKYQI